MSNDISLEEIRGKIDDIDDRLLALLRERFGLIDLVSAAKSARGEDQSLPFRPAREAEIMSRILDAGTEDVPARALWRIWRTIICHASLKQADIEIHTTRPIAANETTCHALEDYFPSIPVYPNASLEAALEQAAGSPFRLCACQAGSDWISKLSEITGNRLKVITMLAPQQELGAENLLILGDAPGAPSGADETLICSNGRLPRDFVPAPLWECETSDGYHVTSLPGFLSPSEGPLIGLQSSNPGLDLKVMGRYPSPLEV